MIIKPDLSVQPALFVSENAMITLYGQPGCNPCRLISNKFDREGIPYDYVDLSQHPEKQRQLQAQGYQSTPIVDTPTERFVGYQPDRINVAMTEVRQQMADQQQQAQHSLNINSNTSEVK